MKQIRLSVVVDLCAVLERNIFASPTSLPPPQAIHLELIRLVGLRGVAYQLLVPDTMGYTLKPIINCGEGTPTNNCSLLSMGKNVEWPPHSVQVRQSGGGSWHPVWVLQGKGHHAPTQVLSIYRGVPPLPPHRAVH